MMMGWNTVCVKCINASEKSFTQPAHSTSCEGGKSVLIMESLWKINLNFVKDVPMIDADFIITILSFSEKNRRHYFHATPHANHIFWHTHSLHRSHTITAVLPTNETQQVTHTIQER
jgi:hypothetical protein